MELSIRFNNKELLNINEVTLDAKTLIIMNDAIFSIIILIWYVLYKANILTFANPYLGILLSLFNNILSFYYLLLDNTSIKNLLLYLIIFIIIKVLPLISLANDIRINYIDVAFTALIYIIYLIILLFIYDYLLKKNLNIFDIIKAEILNKRRIHRN
jgi:hypothetical protein